MHQDWREIERRMAESDRIMRQVEAIDLSLRFVDMERIFRRLARLNKRQIRRRATFLEAIQSAEIDHFKSQQILEQYERISRLSLEDLVLLFQALDAKIESAFDDVSLLGRRVTEVRFETPESMADVTEQRASGSERSKEEFSVEKMHEMYDWYREVSQEYRQEENPETLDKQVSERRVQGLQFAATVGSLMLQFVRFFLN